MCDYISQVSRGNKLYQSSVRGTCWYGIGIFSHCLWSTYSLMVMISFLIFLLLLPPLPHPIFLSTCGHLLKLACGQAQNKSYSLALVEIYHCFIND